MTQDAKTQRLRYRSHAALTTDKIVFTGWDFYTLGGPIKTVIVDVSGLDTTDAYNMVRSLRNWCEKVERECLEEYAAEAQLSLLEGP